jgi:DNA-binding transcriptional LysR family regulator
MVSAAQFEELRSGRLDLALARPPWDATEFGSRLVHTEPLVVALPMTHPLATEAGSLPVGRLADTALPRYSSDQARYFADLTGRVLASVAHTPTDYLTQVHTMVGLVAARLASASRRVGAPLPPARTALSGEPIDRSAVPSAAGGIAAALVPRGPVGQGPLPLKGVSS